MIAEVIKNITSELPASVKLIAVSKFHPVEAVMEAYNIGQRLFGENKEEVNRQAEKADRVIDCLLQIHIAHEETKFGMTFEECRELLNEGTWKQLTHVRICGLMGMATNTDDMVQVEHEFASLQAFLEELKSKWFADEAAFKELSMGMTEDYPIAIRHGSTFIRIGTKIFGERNYNK